MSQTNQPEDALPTANGTLQLDPNTSHLKMTLTDSSYGNMMLKAVLFVEGGAEPSLNEHLQFSGTFELVNESSSFSQLFNPGIVYSLLVSVEFGRLAIVFFDGSDSAYAKYTTSIKTNFQGQLFTNEPTGWLPK